jgi:hypothetical protein
VHEEIDGVDESWDVCDFEDLKLGSVGKIGLKDCWTEGEIYLDNWITQGLGDDGCSEENVFSFLMIFVNILIF